MNSIAPTAPPFQFMLDLYHTVTQNSVTLTDYVQNEKDSDITFCEGWKVLESAENYDLSKPRGWLDLLDKIQHSCVSHLPLHKQGRADRNLFAISKSYRTDEEGLKDLITEIWVNKKPFILQILAADDNQSEAYILKNNKVTYYNKEGKRFVVQPRTEDRRISLQTWFAKFIPCFNKGYCLGAERFILKNHSNPTDREVAVLQIFQTFLNTLQKENLPDEKKIQAVCIAMRDILQQHIYFDCNARSLFLLANLALKRVGLSMFYPENICLFDANSKEKMVREILIGQKRFRDMFGDADILNKNLRSYSASVLELNDLIKLQEKKLSSKNFNVIRKAYEERNFNFLLRLSVTLNNDTSLLIFLLEKIKDFNIDINASGKTSGTAMQIAIRNNHAEAISLLNRYIIISDLNELIKLQEKKISAKDFNALQKSYESRDFNFLLRLSATITCDTELLSFLLDNSQIINIDINARGKTSGSALDIARKKHNSAAVTLIQNYEAATNASTNLNKEI